MVVYGVAPVPTTQVMPDHTFWQYSGIYSHCL